MAQVVKNPPASAGDIRDVGWSMGQEDPLEEGMATHSSILAWRIPRTKEPGGLQSMGSQRVEHNWSDIVHTHTYFGSCFCHQIWRWIVQTINVIINISAFKSTTMLVVFYLTHSFFFSLSPSFLDSFGFIVLFFMILFCFSNLFISYTFVWLFWGGPSNFIEL